MNRLEIEAKLTALAHGRLPARELEELERWASRHPDLEAALECYRPLGLGTRDRVVARAHGDLRRSMVQRAAARAGASVAMVATCAACVAFILTSSPRADALPGYQMSFEGGDVALRGAAPAAERPQLEPESRLRLVLRPELPVEGEVEVHAYWVQGTHSTPLALHWKRSDRGAFLLEGNAKEHLAGHSGEGTLQVEIGRPEDLGDTPSCERNLCFDQPLALRSP